MKINLFTNKVSLLSKCLSIALPLITITAMANTHLAGGFHAGGGVTFDGKSMENFYKPLKVQYPEVSLRLQEKFDTLADKHHGGLASVLEGLAFETLKFYILPGELKNLPFKQMGLDFIKDPSNLKVQQACLNLGNQIYCSEKVINDMSPDKLETLFLHEIAMSFIMKNTPFLKDVEEAEMNQVYASQVLLDKLVAQTPNTPIEELALLESYFKSISDRMKSNLIQLSQKLHNTTRELVTNILYIEHNSAALATQLNQLHLSYLNKSNKLAVVYPGLHPDSPVLVYRFIGTTVSIFSCPAESFSEIRLKQAHFDRINYPGYNLDLKKVISQKTEDNKPTCSSLLGDQILVWNNSGGTVKPIDSLRRAKQEGIIYDAQKEIHIRTGDRGQNMPACVGFIFGSSVAGQNFLSVSAKKTSAAIIAGFLYGSYKCYKEYTEDEERFKSRVNDYKNILNDISARSTIMQMALIHDLSISSTHSFDLTDTSQVSQDWKTDGYNRDTYSTPENFYQDLTINNLIENTGKAVDLLVQSGSAKLVKNKEK